MPVILMMESRPMTEMSQGVVLKPPQWQELSFQPQQQAQQQLQMQSRASPQPQQKSQPQQQLTPPRAAEAEEEEGDEDEEELPPQFDAPDLLEEDPEIIKAELGFFQTPHVQDYSEVVYGTLKNIEDTCALDYASLCARSALPSGAGGAVGARGAVMSLPDFMSQMGFDMSFVPEEDVQGGLFRTRRALASRRRLHGVEKEVPSVGAQLLAETHALLLNPVDTVKRRALSMSRQLHWGHGDTDSDEEEDAGEEGRHGHDHDHEHEHHHDHHGHHHESEGNADAEGLPCGGDMSGAAEDTFFTGALGFGVLGDMCMYQNFDRLSLPCQSTVTDLHELREQYWREESDAMGPGFGRMHHRGPPLPAVLMLFAVLPLAFVAGRKWKQSVMRKRHVLSVLSALDKNPALKAQVEAEAGVSVPSAADMDCPTRRVSLCRVLFVVMASFLTAMFVTLSSVMVASSIVVGLGREDPTTGEMQYPPAPAALSILAATVVVEVMGLTLLARVCRARALRRRPDPDAPPAEATASASAPPTYTAVIYSNNDSTNSGNSSSNASPAAAAAAARDNVVVAINNMRKSIGGLARGLTRPRNQGAAAAAGGVAEGGYTVLPADDVAHMAIVTGVPVTAQQQQGTPGVNWI